MMNQPLPIRSTKEYFLSHGALLHAIGLELSKHVQVVAVERKTIRWGRDKQAGLDSGYIVTVIEEVP